MLYHSPFQPAKVLIVNTNRNVTGVYYMFGVCVDGGGFALYIMYRSNQEF